MKRIIWMLALSMMAGGVQAQESMSVELQPSPEQVQTQKQIVVQEVQAAPATQTYVLPQQQVQQQPTTYVEAAPLVKTRADVMRERRQQVEASTEQKIVEKLEQSRMEDEKRRAERLFGDRFENNETQMAAPAPQPVQQAPAPVIQATPVVVPVAAPVQQVEDNSAEEQKAALEDMKNEIIATLKPAEKPKAEKSYFISGQVGMADYVDVSNVDSNVATGFSVGMKDESGFTVEGGFTYSNYYVDEGYWAWNNPVFQEMDQYNYTISATYSPLKGRLQPRVGGLVSYVYRKYGEFYSNWNGNYETGNNADSKSFDMGLVAGVDLDLSDSFTIGFDYRYMMNVTNKTSSPYLGSRYINPVGTPIEELNYQVFSLSAKARF